MIEDCIAGTATDPCCWYCDMIGSCWHVDCLNAVSIWDFSLGIGDLRFETNDCSVRIYINATEIGYLDSSAYDANSRPRSSDFALPSPSVSRKELVVINCVCKADEPALREDGNHLSP